MAEVSECDYLVIGAGDMGMAFVDSLLVGAANIKVKIVDPCHLPGGRWHEACPSAQLHLPNVYYGCSHHRLGNDKAEPTSKEDTLAEARWVSATRSELLDYFNDVMHRFVEKYGVEYYPMSTYDETTSQIIHKLNKQNTLKVTVKRKIVNTNYVIQELGSGSHAKPPFDVVEGGCVLPVYDLSKVVAPHSHYVVIGSGRTGMDAVLWLLSAGISSSIITWIVPRDQLCFVRESAVPDRWVDKVILFKEMVAQLKASPRCLEDLIARLLDQEILCHVHDDNEAPRYRGRGARMAFHGAYVTKEELTRLRQVTDVVRLGHVRAVGLDGLALDDGYVSQPIDTLYIDCTDSSMREAPSPVPIFEDRKITLQYVQELGHAGGFWNSSFHASYLGFLEGWRPQDTAWKNSRSTSTRPVDTFVGWLEAQVASYDLDREWNTAAPLPAEALILKWLTFTPPGCFCALSAKDKARISNLKPSEAYLANLRCAIRLATSDSRISTH